MWMGFPAALLGFLWTRCVRCFRKFWPQFRATHHQPTTPTEGCGRVARLQQLLCNIIPTEGASPVFFCWAHRRHLGIQFFPQSPTSSPNTSLVSRCPVFPDFAGFVPNSLFFPNLLSFFKGRSPYSLWLHRRVRFDQGSSLALPLESVSHN